MKYLIWILVAVLLIVHQDNWNWNNDTMVFGFIPYGLFYHAIISLAAGFVWLLACTFAWPKEFDETEVSETKGSGNGGQPS